MAIHLMAGAFSAPAGLLCRCMSRRFAHHSDILALRACSNSSKRLRGSSADADAASAGATPGRGFAAMAAQKEPPSIVQLIAAAQRGDVPATGPH